MYRLIIFLCALCLLQSCAPVNLVKPLRMGEHRVAASLGGPLIKFSGAVIPIPASSIRYARGLSDKFSIYGSVYTTAALFGVAQIDAGICRSIYQKDSTAGFTMNAGFNTGTFFQPGTSRLWPELALNYYRHYGKHRHYVYAGTGTWIELARNGTYGREIQNRLLPWFHLGHVWSRGRFAYQLEYRMLAPFQTNQDVVVDYLKLTGNRGVSGLYFTFSRRLGK